MTFRKTLFFLFCFATATICSAADTTVSQPVASPEKDKWAARHPTLRKAMDARWGIGQRIDISKQVELLKQATKEGDKAAQALLATFYWDGGSTVTLDHPRAKKMFASSVSVLTKAIKTSPPDPYAAYALAKTRDIRLHDYDPTETARLLKIAADADLPAACMSLAYVYRTGDGVERNRQEADRLMDRAISLGSQEAEVYKALDQVMNDQPGDTSQSIQTLLQGAANGSVMAKHYLGHIYEDGTSVTQDNQAAFAWYLQAAEEGDTAAMVDLAEAYTSSTMVAPDTTKSLEFYHRAADMGDVTTMEKLGYGYATGYQVERGHKRSFHYLEQALNLGSGYAAYYLGFMHERGNGVTTDVQKAVRYYNQGVELEEPDAIIGLIELIHKEPKLAKQRERIPALIAAAEATSASEVMGELGDMFRYGEIVPENAERAFQYYLRGASGGNLYCMGHVAACYQDGYGVKEDYLAALRYMRKGAELGDPWSMSQLGYKYLTGEDVEQSDITARDYIVPAAEMGDTDAMDYMGYMYEAGIGFEEDTNKAIEWYKKAAEAGSDHAPERLRELQSQGKPNRPSFWEALLKVSREQN